MGVHALCRSSLPDGGTHAVRDAAGYEVFYEYYQISTDDESSEAETEPKKEGELKSEYKSSHSPFGIVWQIAEATGWSKEYILDGINYQTLLLMIADAPHYVSGKKEEKKGADGNGKDEVLEFFQSNLSL